MVNIMRSCILIFTTLALICPGQFLLAQETPRYADQAPQTLEETKDLGFKILEELPSAMQKVWKEDALPLWGKMWKWAKPIIEPWWNKFLNLLGKEVEKRRPELEKELQKETKELQKDLWERFKDLLEDI